MLKFDICSNDKKKSLFKTRLSLTSISSSIMTLNLENNCDLLCKDTKPGSSSISKPIVCMGSVCFLHGD